VLGSCSRTQLTRSISAWFLPGRSRSSLGWVSSSSTGPRINTSLIFERPTKYSHCRSRSRPLCSCIDCRLSTETHSIVSSYVSPFTTVWHYLAPTPPFINIRVESNGSLLGQ
jgi:hypothetical protein